LSLRGGRDEREEGESECGEEGPRHVRDRDVRERGWQLRDGGVFPVAQ
jgi:hypothetical protein